ncbi:MAG: hypothetical protein VB095_13470 [Anaerovorax sp.]|nr:hypothetical protein [Anaerovorax sp.]
MKTNVNVFFDVPERAYKVLEMISEQKLNVDLYCMGQNKILLAASLEEDCSDLELEDESEDWEDIEDFEDFPF